MRRFYILTSILLLILISAIGCDRSGPMTYEKAVERLDYLLKHVEWSENYVNRRARIQLDASQDMAAMLPSIDEFALMNRPAASGNALVLEIFASTEKSGTGTDGWMVEVANDFNSQNNTLNNGQRVYVDVRKIASGTGYEFIASRKHLPDGFSPSSHLWVQMAEAQGVQMTPIREQMVGNIAGIVMKSSVAEEMKSTYGSLDIKNLIDAVVQGNLFRARRAKGLRLDSGAGRAEPHPVALAGAHTCSGESADGYRFVSAGCGWS
jgi:Ca-activated chloride channel family protein